MNFPSSIDTPPSQSKTGKQKTYAQVVFNLPIRESFTYEIPNRFEGQVEVGMRVFVPFGRRRITGYVVSLADKWEKDIPLKPIEDLPDTHPIISTELLALTQWIADYYQSSWGEAIKAALPAGLDEESLEMLTLSETGALALENEPLSESAFLMLETIRQRKRLSAKQIQRTLNKKFSAHTLVRLKQNGLLTCETQIKRSTINYKYEKIARLTDSAKDIVNVEELFRRSPKQKAIYQFLIKGEKTLSALTKEFSSSSAPLKKLEQKGLVEIRTLKIRRNSYAAPNENTAAEQHLKFTPGQESIFKELCRSIDAPEYQTFLLHGVTGSGKTEIYIQCIQRVLELGKTAVMMVPEISLTPQTVGRFQSRFGNRVAILHSGLSNMERYREWEKIKEEKVSIVVGARSAVFAPLKNPGIFVIDEEHDASYKQDSSPRYHARDTAIVRARAENAVVILGSATPSLESMRNTESGKYRYLSIKRRIGDRLLPVVQITDMRKDRRKNKNFSILSSELKIAIRNRLERKEQSFLFLNRRGTANYVTCTECGYVYHCPRCSVTLTFHGNQNLLRCHYCDLTTRTPETCSECRGIVIKFKGFGTQKLEEETRQLFPQARIVRLDRDTTRKRNAFDSMHQLMTSGEIDILIGTQMITKGHDFPNVTLVGVVHADLSLNIPDFRSSERTYQLLTQVAGRAGRGSVPGQVIIQSYNPEHYVFDFVQEHDGEKFYETELTLRKKLNYPPFTRMAVLEIESEVESLGQSMARKIQQTLSRLIDRQTGMELLGPSPAALYRINNKFRRHLILRAPEIHSLQTVLRRYQETEVSRTFSRSKVKLSIDVDPVNLL